MTQHEITQEAHRVSRHVSLTRRASNGCQLVARPSHITRHLVDAAVFYL